MAAYPSRGARQDDRACNHEVRALDGVDLEVQGGHPRSACWGRTAAEKTTPTAFFFDILADGRRKPKACSACGEEFQSPRASRKSVRKAIGLSGGAYAAVDENLTGRENLWMFGRLYGSCSRKPPTASGEDWAFLGGMRRTPTATGLGGNA